LRSGRKSGRFIYPDVPRFAEVGLRKVLSETWIGLAGPANMPNDLVNKINDAIMARHQVAGDPEAIFTEIGVDVIAEGPVKVHQDRGASEVDTYQVLAREMNLTR